MARITRMKKGAERRSGYEEPRSKTSQRPEDMTQAPVSRPPLSAPCPSGSFPGFLDSLCIFLVLVLSVPSV